MSYNIEKMLDVLMKWRSGGLKETAGARLICHVPHVAPEAWLHQIYKGLPDEQLYNLEKQLRVTLPNDLSEFFRAANGINIFSDAISIWGVRTSFERIGDNVYQPYDLVSLNNERPKGCPTSWLYFGSYSWDGSRMFFDVGTDSLKVYRTERRTPNILNEWPDFWTWLSEEVDRVSTLFDETGRKYDKKVPTTPPNL